MGNNKKKNFMVTKCTKMGSYVGSIVTITIIDNRNYTGKLLAFDSHMNIVLSEATETRMKKNKKNTQKTQDTQNTQNETIYKRSLGLMMIKGHQIVTVASKGDVISA